MPVLRNGVRRGRKRKDQQEERRVSERPNVQIEEQGIATRTRRRRAAAAAAAAAVAEVAPVAADENLVVAAAAAPEVQARRVVKEEAVPGKEGKEKADKPMDDYESAGKSNDKGNAADDEGINGPLPQKVCNLKRIATSHCS